MNIYVIKAVEKEIEKFEEYKKNFPNPEDEWMYEPDLTQLKKGLELMKNVKFDSDSLINELKRLGGASNV